MRRRRKFVGLFAMFVSCIRMMLSILMLSSGVMMFGLMMVVRRSMVMSGSRVMMLLRGMLWRLCHLGVPSGLVEFNLN